MPVRPPLALPLLALAGFVVLLALVLGDWKPLHRLDVAASDDFREYGAANPGVVSAVRVVTDVMGTLAFIGVGVAATALAAARRLWRIAGLCAAVTAVIPLLWSVMHVALHRPRPVDAFVSIDSSGFPSGHTSNAAATAVLGVLLLWPGLARAGRAAAVALAAAFAAAIGLTRVALLAHWPSDVVGGWLLGLAVVPLLAVAFTASRRAPAPAPGSPPGRDYADRASSAEPAG